MPKRKEREKIVERWIFSHVQETFFCMREREFYREEDFSPSVEKFLLSRHAHEGERERKRQGGDKH